MTNVAVNAVRNEPMALAQFECDRPVRAQVRVRTVEEPESRCETGGTGDKRSGAKRVFRGRKYRRRDPDEWYEEADPCQCQQENLRVPL